MVERKRLAELARHVIDGLGENQALEQPAKKIGSLAQQMTAGRAVKNTLSGTWLGHRVHPPLTDLVVGSWSWALVLDVLGGREARHAADRLVAAGLVAAVPTALAGLNDYSDLHGHGRRVAFVHLVTIDVALTLQATSLLARRRGNRGAGLALSAAGMATTTAAAWLGGHLSYVLGVGVDHTAFDDGPSDWQEVAAADAVTQQPTMFTLDGRELLLLRVDGQVVALANRCGHAGGPLSDGEFADGCVTCPWHGSTFRLADGGVVRGPAASPQRGYDVREIDGRIEVRGRR